MHTSRGSKAMLPWKIFVNMVSRMARMHMALLIIRRFDLKLIPQNLIEPFDSYSFQVQLSSKLALTIFLFSY